MIIQSKQRIESNFCQIVKDLVPNGNVCMNHAMGCIEHRMETDENRNRREGNTQETSEDRTIKFGMVWRDKIMLALWKSELIGH